MITSISAFRQSPGNFQDLADRLSNNQDVSAWLELIKAHSEGKQIEAKCTKTGKWGVLSILTFERDITSYRVRPEPRAGSIHMDVWVHPELGYIWHKQPLYAKDYIKARINCTWEEILE